MYLESDTSLCPKGNAPVIDMRMPHPFFYKERTAVVSRENHWYAPHIPFKPPISLPPQQIPATIHTLSRLRDAPPPSFFESGHHIANIRNTSMQYWAEQIFSFMHTSSCSLIVVQNIEISEHAPCTSINFRSYILSSDPSASPYWWFH